MISVRTMMKILFINTIKLDKNGITTFILNNAKFLAQTNDVSILASNEVDSSIRNILVANNIKLIRVPYRKKKPLQYFQGLKQIIKNEKYDVVHVNGNSATMSIELLAARLAGCNCRIAHVHNTVTDHPIIHNLLYPIFAVSLTARMACSNAAGQWLYKGKSFYTINNGVNMSEYVPSLKARNSIRDKYGIKESEILLGNIGFFNLQKNQEALIPIIEQLDKKYKLLLIGDGILKEKIEKIVNDHHLSTRIFFSGNVDNVKDYLSAIDLFVMTSKFEGLPFALVEAQSSGLHCIVSDKVSKEADLTENVQFVSLNNNDDWIDTILDASKNYTFERRVSVLNNIQRRIIDKNYDAQKNAKYLENIFKKLLE